MTTATRNGAVLTAQEATIKTAQVEIQVLKVGNKQVTMGMFRQLPYRDLINWLNLPIEDLSQANDPTIVRGEPWGHVNYWWTGDDEKDDTYTDEYGRWLPHGEKRHIVWQDEEQLCRAIVCERLPKWVYELPRDLDAAALQERWGAIWHTLLQLPQLFIAV
jgi:hypothetical protein